MSRGSIIRPRYGSAVSGRESGLIVGYEFDAQEGTLINKEVTGLAGGTDGTIAGARQMHDPIHGRGLKFLRGSSNVSFTQTGDTHTAGTIIVTVRPWALAGGTTYMLFRSLAGATRYYAHFAATGLYTWFGNIGANQDTGVTAVVGQSFRVAITWTSSHVYVFVNGNPVDDYATTMADDIATMFLGAWDATFVNGLDGEEYNFKLYRRQLSAQEVLADYREYSTRCRYMVDFDRFRVSPAAEGGTQHAFLSNTLWQFGEAGGRWQVVDAVIDGQRTKSIRCTTAGQLYIPAQVLGMEGTNPEMAYGTFDFWLNKAAATVPNVAFIGSTFSFTGLNGYILRVDATEAVSVIRYNAGVAAATIHSSAAAAVNASEWNRFKVARRYDGRIYTFINGVALVAAVGTNPSTDNNHTNGSFFVIDLDANDEIAFPSLLWGEVI